MSMSDVRIITEPLGGSKLAQRLQRADTRTPWLAPTPAGVEAWSARAAHRAAQTDWRARWTALAPAIRATGAAAERLDRVQREGGVVVTTGQQPGLFGGPIYTWSKAVGALALADEIQARTGIATAAIFWAATDDADFAEASRAAVARTGGVEVLRSTHAPKPGTPMSLAPLGNLQEQLMRLRDAARSAADPRALDAVVAAYGDPTHTVGDAFVQLLRALLEPLGIPVIDASHEAVRTASAPTIEKTLQSATAIEQALRVRADAMTAEGFEPQVEDVPGLSLAFMREGSTKRRLTVAEAAQINTKEAWLTPNVLLRPIVEHAILPTVAYLAGPGELSYFAQVSAVAEAMGVESPTAVPRWSCTLLEPDIEALLDRYGATIAEVGEPHTLETRVARHALDSSASDALAKARAMIASLPDALRQESERLGLDDAVKGAARGLELRVDRLERRLIAGVKRHETAVMRDLATLRGALFPFGERQERVLNATPFFARYGTELLARMCTAAHPHAAALVNGTLTTPGAARS
jgi:bacillithiol biosynthesis cysteine-adding enzyme BshC